MTDNERMLKEDRLTRATNALYDFEYRKLIEAGMPPPNPEMIMNFLRLKAEAVLRAADHKM